jgi:hypothetical protein
LAFGGYNGIIYAVDLNGDLLFYRDLAQNGTANWANGGQPQQIGTGWSQVRLAFGGYNGIIYAVNPNGDLIFFQDLAQNGTANWANGGQPQVIGGGWQTGGIANTSGGGSNSSSAAQQLKVSVIKVEQTGAKGENMIVHSRVEAIGYKSQSITVTVFFKDSNGQWLRTQTGYISASRTLQSTYDDSVWADLPIQLDARELQRLARQSTFQYPFSALVQVKLEGTNTAVSSQLFEIRVEIPID